MKPFIGIVVLLSLLFLFGGLIAVGMTGDEQSGKAAETKSAHSSISQQVTEKYSMKEIDSLSSKYNFTFTSVNGSSSANMP